MRHQAQKGFCGILSSYYVVFEESFSSTLAYISRRYSEVMDMHPYMSYIPCDKYWKEHTGNIIKFAQLEEGGLLSETREDAKNDDKISDKSNDN